MSSLASPQVVLGGGQEAREVTTTTTKAGKFDARFYHLIYEEEIGRVKGHFGPINSLKFHPDGKRWASIRTYVQCVNAVVVPPSLPPATAVVEKMATSEYTLLTQAILNLNSDTPTTVCTVLL